MEEITTKLTDTLQSNSFIVFFSQEHLLISDFLLPLSLSILYEWLLHGKQTGQEIRLSSQEAVSNGRDRAEGGAGGL